MSFLKDCLIDFNKKFKTVILVLIALKERNVSNRQIVFFFCMKTV